jgi:prepilin-type N-terminal cleavage/methylation domain-containing protein
MRNRGFTLPEVLATMLLLGIILPAVMYAMTTAMRVSARARHTAEASQLAQYKLNELALTNDTTQFTGTGTFGDEWPEYRWEASFTTGGFDVYVVTVRVAWSEQGTERFASLSTMVAPSTSTTGGTEVVQ